MQSDIITFGSGFLTQSWEEMITITNQPIVVDAASTSTILTSTTTYATTTDTITNTYTTSVTGPCTETVTAHDIITKTVKAYLRVCPDDRPAQFLSRSLRQSLPARKPKRHGLLTSCTQLPPAFPASSPRLSPLANVTFIRSTSVVVSFPAVLCPWKRYISLVFVRSTLTHFLSANPSRKLNQSNEISSPVKAATTAVFRDSQRLRFTPPPL